MSPHEWGTRGSFAGANDTPPCHGETVARMGHPGFGSIMGLGVGIDVGGRVTSLSGLLFPDPYSLFPVPLLLGLCGGSDGTSTLAVELQFPG